MSHKFRAPKRRRLSPPAEFILRLGLTLSALMLAAALLLAVWAGPLDPRNIHIHRLAADLYRTPQSVLLVCALGALIAEDRYRGS